MASNVAIVHSKDFIRARPTGEIDLETSEALLAEIARTAELLPDVEVLIDTREIQGALSATDLWFLAAKLVQYRGVFARKTAVLCPMEKFDRTRFFALCAENQGVRIHAFTSYEEAMEWLLGAK